MFLNARDDTLSTWFSEIHRSHNMKSTRECNPILTSSFQKTDKAGSPQNDDYKYSQRCLCGGNSGEFTMSTFCDLLKPKSTTLPDLQDSEVQSYVPLPIPASTSVNVNCDYTHSSNVTNITELHKYNSNVHDQEFFNGTTTT
ncbi:hypothetical protein MS3_00007095 [Schistosoma haematobium]|uniref:Uncharacterized protein n=1 Tax=Schistosoma haematobium TaxID=6185 RepID=A0A6A5DHI3_SCHHA|nr:hypothetical protein MS3_00007095 [Schistosoma haematobium]KAH9586036.1 hypothetical protein MS3_00007095 [Schistosoma haematobium]